MVNIYPNKKSWPVVLIFLLVLANACRVFEHPLILTLEVEDVTHNQATAAGHVIDDGGREVTVRGLVWGDAPDPDLENHIGMIEEGEGTGIFSGRLTGLTPNTTYYVRAFATNREGTSYGDYVQFTTEPATPDVATSDITGIEPTRAVSGGIVRDDRGEAVTARGIVWSREVNPTLENYDGITSDGEGTGTFKSAVTGLRHSTDYHVRAYATNSVGTAYGRQISFTTSPPEAPSLTTAEITSVRAASAVSGGRVISDGGAPVTARGVVVSTSEAPQIDDYVGITRDGQGPGSFTSMIIGLEHGTLYYLRAWATNEGGTSYGNQLSFATLEPVPPLVNLITISDIDVFTATGEVNVQDDGGVDVTARGLVWSRIDDPDIENYEGISTVGDGTGEFAGELEKLRPGTRYYVKAWATNEVGTAYSKQLQFTTKVNLPVVSTVNLMGYTISAALFNSRVTDDGGDPETYRGMVIGTAENPEVDNYDFITYNGVGWGDYTSEFTGLKPGTTYYARAYASNAAGTTYGRQGRFTTIEECGSTVDFIYRGEPVIYGSVESAGGACWMDRNLGASQVAGSFYDRESFGDLYQWGRLEDGHQDRRSGTTTNLSDSDVPGHGDFIISESDPFDWRFPQNDNLWKGDGGRNDVCPPGWRLPTWEEWDEEVSDWDRKNRRGAFNSSLKLPAAGLRSNNQKLFDIGRRGYYWGSDVDSIYTGLLNFNRRSAIVNVSSRAGSRSVRCIRQEVLADIEWLP